MEKEKAETIGLQALAFLVKDEEILERFLTASGLTLQELKSRFHDSDLLGAVLDMILSDDTVLLAFCNSASLSPESIIRARRILPGGYDDYGD
jgi:hypothetical protein